MSGPIEEPSPITSERHPLADVAQRAAVLDQRLVGPAQHVDEAGGDRHAGGVDLGRAALAGQIADLHDAVAVDGDVGLVRLDAGAVVDGAAANDDVVVGALGTGGQQNDKRQK